MPYALIDPNWGKPKPVLSTVRDDVDAAWAAAVSPKNRDDVRLYSGASQYPLPHGTSGHVDTLKQYGFTVQAVDVLISRGEIGEIAFTANDCRDMAYALEGCEPPEEREPRLLMTMAADALRKAASKIESKVAENG
jgi:hypothetical protein